MKPNNSHDFIKITVSMCLCVCLFSGLETLFHLTLRKKYELLVDMEDFDGNKVYARYSSFSIDSESNGYRLNVSGFTNGGAGGLVEADFRRIRKVNTC